MNTAKLLSSIIETAIDGIITIDSFGIVETINPAALKLFGYEADEVIGQNIKILMPEPDRSRHDMYIQNYQKTGVKKIIGIGREVLGRKKDGTTFPFRLAVSEVVYDNFSIFAGFIHDLSKEKKVEEDLFRHLEELENTVENRTKDLRKSVQELEQAKIEVSNSLMKEIELNQLKSRFVSMASHEFRTPLSAVQLSASLIEKYVQKEDTSNILKHTYKIKNSVQLLNSILSDFLNLERLESGKVAVNKESVNLVSLAEEITEEMQLICKKNQHILYQHTGSTGMFLLDINLIKNAIINLISNAIKYSGEDSFIQFMTEIEDDSCTIMVSDNVIGIPKEEQIQYSEAFIRANNKSNIQDTELVINIVKRYISLMGGEVTFESEVGKGTTVTLKFKQ